MEKQKKSGFFGLGGSKKGPKATVEEKHASAVAFAMGRTPSRRSLDELGPACAPGSDASEAERATAALAGSRLGPSLESKAAGSLPAGKPLNARASATALRCKNPVRKARGGEAAGCLLI
jgi:hypothetical protein